MAEIRKIVSSGQISQFRQVAPEAGGAFRLLALAADEAYKRFEPAAIKQMEEKGAELGHEMARGQIGSPTATGLNPRFSTAIDTMFAAAPPEIRSGLGIGSGFRSVAEQQVLYDQAMATYGSNTVPGHQVAAPGHSQHNFGMAVDLSFGSPEARAWAHENAPRFGMHFPVPGEDWHVELVDGRTVQPPAAMVRTSTGDLEGRLYSPMAGPILQAHNVAAGVAYQSDVMLSGMAEMMAIGERFINNPAGFQEAARGYIDTLVANAPAEFRGDIRASLETEMQRRYLGVLEDQQREVRQRAANSSSALAKRWQQTYAEAIAAGSVEEAASAWEQLNSILSARERLPGIAWTPEQSMNFIADGERMGAEMIQRNTNAQVGSWKKSLALIGTAAMDGLAAGDESILNDESVRAALPEEWAAAAAKVEFREALPSFSALPPAEQRAAVDALREDPVFQTAQIDIIGAADAAAKASQAAWDKDPIAQAERVLPNKPPQISTSGDPEDIAASMAARVAYGQALVAQGFTTTPAYLSDAEAETLGALMGKASPPDVRASLAAAIVAGAGSNAAGILQEAKIDDPVTKLGGMLAARGGNAAVLMQAYQGQAMIDEGLVQAPTAATRVAGVSSDIATALDAARVPMVAQGDLLKFAVAIYASQARSIDPTDDEAVKELLAQSINTALGQSTNRRGDTVGGVQDINGAPTLLPLDMSGKDVTASLTAAFTAPVVDTGVKSAFEAFASMFGGADTELNEAMWDAASIPRGENPDGIKLSNLPMLGGIPLERSAFDRGHVSIAPISGNFYRMSVNGADVRDSNGDVFIFDLPKLVAAMP